MKLSLTAVIFFACLAVAYSRSCEEADDCGANECCVAYTQLGLVGSGRCVRLERQGRRCNEPEAALDYYGGKYLLRCPCQEGLVCEVRGERNNSGNRLSRSLRQRCQRPTATTTTTSSTTSTTTEAPTSPTTEAPTTPTTLEG